MTIAQFFSTISKNHCPVLPAGVNTASTIVDFFTECIENNLPKMDVVIAWHNLLKKYIEDPEARFFVRRYASTKKDGEWDIRRGFLTVYDNTSFVFVDNFFAHYFYAMAINNFVPDYDDFKGFILDRKIPYGYSVVSLERGHQAYYKGSQYPINTRGWKLSHIFSANENDYNFNYRSESAALFPKVTYGDFVMHGGYSYPFRKIDGTVSEDDLKKIKAHFLRVVHPINHFLTPKTTLQLSSIGIKDIGEYAETIAFMKEKLSKMYGKVFTEYQKMIMAPTIKTLPSSGKFSPIGLTYGMGLSKTGATPSIPGVVAPAAKGVSKTTRKKTMTTIPTAKKALGSFTPDVVANCIKAYLFDGYSFRTIEKEIMGLEYRVHGGGFVAKKLLESKGINSSMKKKFYGQTIDTAIDLSAEPLKTTLKWIKSIL